MTWQASIPILDFLVLSALSVSHSVVSDSL